MKKRTLRLGWLVACWLLIAAVAPGNLIGQDAPDPLWTYTTDEDIKVYALTGLGTVLVGTKEKTVVLDPETGSVLWETTDLRECGQNEVWAERCKLRGSNRNFSVATNSPYMMLSDDKDGTEAWDLETGEAVWDSNEVVDFRVDTVVTLWDRGLWLLVGRPEKDGSTLAAVNMPSGEREWVVDLPFVKTWGVLAWSDNPLLLSGETENSKNTLLALDAQTGSVLWTQDRVPRAGTWPWYQAFNLGFRPPRSYGFFDGDSVVVLYPNPRDDGPMGLDVGTGEVLWHHEKYDDACCAEYANGTVFIAHGKEITALNAADGEALWTIQYLTDHDIPRFFYTDGRLIIGCDEEFCRDFPEARSSVTGELLWPARVGLEAWRPSSHVLVGDLLFYSFGLECYRLALVTGNHQELGSCQVGLVGRRKEIPGGVLFASEQAMAVFNLDGSSRYNTRYEGPESARLLPKATTDVFRGYALTTPLGGIGDAPYRMRPRWQERYARSAEAAGYAYLYTNEPDFDGREGFGLVRVREDDGVEVSRAWVPIKNTQRSVFLGGLNYVLDPIGERVFFLRDDKELVAMGFEPSL